MITRSRLVESVRQALARSRIVGLLGPRQCGKTTLASQLLARDSANYFDLEDPASLARLDEPMTALAGLKDLAVIDEIQRRPKLFPVLRVLVDRVPSPARFLVVGSGSPTFLRQSSESLAGRIAYIHMSGFSLEEVGAAAQARHWLRGGFPLSYLAEDDAQSSLWRRDFIRTFLERDLGQMGLSVPSATLLRFWTMAAHYHGQIWDDAEIAGSMGLGQKSYLNALTDLYMIRQLQPWHGNLEKRQVRSPKIFFRDTGLLHCLLGLRTEKDLLTHAKCGALWEGYVMEETIKAVEPQEAFFWAAHQGAEIDLVLIKDGHMLGAECKRVDAPRLTPSMRIALDDLGLERVAVVYPGTKRFLLAEQVEAVPLEALVHGVNGLFPG